VAGRRQQRWSIMSMCHQQPEPGTDMRPFFARQLLRCESQGMLQYVELGRSLIHLLQLPQSTLRGRQREIPVDDGVTDRYGSTFATKGSARKYAMRSSSVRLARRRFGGGGPPVSWCCACEIGDCSIGGALGETRVTDALDGGTAGRAGEPPVGLRVPGLGRVISSGDGTPIEDVYHRAMCASQ
jgi:hypothetical protein